MSEIPNTTKEYIIGVDEVGTGSWAGALVVVGVRATKRWSLDNLNDSKKLSAKRREASAAQLEKLISSNEITWALAEQSNLVIDQLGLGVALKDAYVEVFKQLYRDDCLIICDGTLKFNDPEVSLFDKISVIKADTKYSQVMAASILAKVYRDSKMKMLHQQYPVYGWNKNVGYHSAYHVEALQKHGPCPLHRFSYDPIKKMQVSYDQCNFSIQSDKKENH